jgi:ATP-dependent DNA helicase RecG
VDRAFRPRREGWRDWRSSLASVHAEPADERRPPRLAYDEIFANQLALALLRQVSRRRAACPCAAMGGSPMR